MSFDSMNSCAFTTEGEALHAKKHKTAARRFRNTLLTIEGCTVSTA